MPPAFMKVYVLPDCSRHAPPCSAHKPFYTFQDPRFRYKIFPESPRSLSPTHFLSSSLQVVLIPHVTHLIHFIKI